MALPQSETDYLTARGHRFTVSEEANMTCIVLHDFPLPKGCTNERADLLLRLNPGFPDVPPDMWWFHPPVFATDGRTIEATQSVEHHVGRDWQRWSRHFTNGQWQPGIDSLETYVALIQREVARCTAPAT